MDFIVTRFDGERTGHLADYTRHVGQAYSRDGERLGQLLYGTGGWAVYDPESELGRRLRVRCVASYQSAL